QGRARHDRRPAQGSRRSLGAACQIDRPATARLIPSTDVPQRFSTLGDWLAWFETLHPKEIDMSLDRLSAVLDLLALRPPPYKVITVGGTNGKGSCVAILESIYREAGYKVGTFTSPHLWRFNERIR